MNYEDVIGRYLYGEFPQSKPKPGDRFEAVSAAVLGTKQRRYGAALSPEDQVAVRERVRVAVDHDGIMEFNVPWGSSKLTPGALLDSAELAALKQLACLAADLKRYDVESIFNFRMENLTDLYLFEDAGREGQVATYLGGFRTLAQLILGRDAVVMAESDVTSFARFKETADRGKPLFLEHIVNPTPSSQADLMEIGWAGTIPQEQKDYYFRSYLGRYRWDEHADRLASYFAATWARGKLKATREVGPGTAVKISFAKPVPAIPVKTARVYYRTIPERYTNNHLPPWNAKGYLLVGDEQTTPKLLMPGDMTRIERYRAKWEGVELDLDYAIA